MTPSSEEPRQKTSAVPAREAAREEQRAGVIGFTFQFERRTLPDQEDADPPGLHKVRVGVGVGLEVGLAFLLG